MTDNPLRALVEKWRAESDRYGRLHQKQMGYEIDFSDDARSVILERVADELETALAAPAQDAVATVCLVGDRYAHGHMVEVQLQLAGEDAPTPKIGDRYYTTPPTPSGNAALPSWMMQRLADAAAALDKFGRRDQCVDLMNIYDALAGQAQATKPQAQEVGRDGEAIEAKRYRWLVTTPDYRCEPIQEMWSKVTLSGRRVPTKIEWDAAIDSAMADQQESSDATGKR